MIDKIAEFIAKLFNRTILFIANIRDFILALIGKIELQAVI